MTPETFPLIKVRVAHTGTCVVVTVAGELDMASVPELESVLNHVIASDGAPEVALELGDLTFCDSSGLGMLVRVRQSLVRRGGRLLLMHVRAQLADCLRRTGLDRVLPTAEGQLASDGWIRAGRSPFARPEPAQGA